MNETARERFFPGGFHTDLEELRMMGKTFRDVYEIFLKTHLKTIGRVNWIVSPSDPRDSDAVATETYLAIECAAIDCFRESFPLLPCTASAVHEHKINCAKENPLLQQHHHLGMNKK